MLKRKQIHCRVAQALGVLAGRWRLTALSRLGLGPIRFNALQRALPPVMQKLLVTTLRGLFDDGLFWRRSANTIPPEVTYG